MAKQRKAIKRLDWQYWLSRIILINLGTALAAVSMVLFYIPANIAPAGVSGTSVILNALLGTPVGAGIFWLNLPIIVIGARMLSGWRTLLETIYAIILLSILIDGITYFYHPDAVSDDMILNALFGGILGGIGSGLIFRAGGTTGGTTTLSRILNEKFGLPLSSASLYTDTGVLLGAGVVLGWEAAMYSTLSLFVNRMAMDYIAEGGASSTNTAIIITRQPKAVIKVLQHSLKRSMTTWQGTGTYSGQTQSVIFLTLSRSETNMLRHIMALTDPNAFISILKGQVTFGHGFNSVHPQLPLKLDQKDDAKTGSLNTQELRQIVISE